MPDDDGKPRAGSVRLDGDTLTFTRRDRVEWSVGLDELALVGELCTDRGPYDDDLVVVLVRRDGTWFELPFDAQGAKEVLAELERRLGADLALRFCNRTDWVSRVSWPSDLAGTPLFDLRPAPRDSGWFRGLWDWAFPRLSVELSAAARSRCSDRKTT
ncbi:MAG: hypothetical protein IPJ77_00465 [Planctomycetes bacterium]|nr:hypothetical protein [Planctomycetota bacterium]